MNNKISKLLQKCVDEKENAMTEKTKIGRVKLISFIFSIITKPDNDFNSIKTYKNIIIEKLNKRIVYL